MRPRPCLSATASRVPAQFNRRADVFIRVVVHGRPLSGSRIPTYSNCKRHHRARPGGAMIGRLKHGIASHAASSAGRCPVPAARPAGQRAPDSGRQKTQNTRGYACFSRSVIVPPTRGRWGRLQFEIYHSRFRARCIGAFCLKSGATWRQSRGVSERASSGP